MAKIGLFFGTQTETTQDIAERIQKELGGDSVVDLYDISGADVTDGYADNFQDAIGILEEKITSLGGTTVGYWSTEGYEFDESKAVKNGKFVGLAIDETNQSELTDERIKTWSAQLKQEFGM
jgi:flavodoxin I